MPKRHVSPELVLARRVDYCLRAPSAAVASAAMHPHSALQLELRDLLERLDFFM